MSVFFSIVWHLPITDSTLSYILCSVRFHISMLSYSIKLWLPPLWYLNQQNFKLSTNSSRICQNNSSMLLESSCSEMENRKDEIDLPRGHFHFPRSGLPAKVWQSDRGWTVQIEENVSFLKANQLSLRDSPLQSTTFKQHGYIFYAF